MILSNTKIYDNLFAFRVGVKAPNKGFCGSSTQISDISANIIHHIEYMPYGEIFVEQRSNWGTNYKFNGKELDEETGYYYYGARYYNPDISIWLSVDPLADKYPSMSPYMYCAGNPVILVDPDGRSYGHYVDGDGNVVGKDKNDDDRIFLVYGNDLSKVKADKFNKGVSQSNLSNPVELPSYEERQMLGCLYEQGINYKESELGLLMYNSESGSFRGDFYQSSEKNVKEVGQYKQKGGINFSTAYLYDKLGDTDANTPKIIAHLHNVSDMKTPPSRGGDKLGGGFKLGVVFDYDKNGHNTYIYNTKTKIRENSRMNTESFLKPFITPSGKNL